MKQYVSVILNGRELVFPKEEGYGIPFIDEKNRMMIPFRKPVEAIGAAVSYDENTKEVTAVKDGRTYIPLRAVFSAFGYDLNWHSVSNTVYAKP